MFYLRCVVANRYQAQSILPEIGIIGQNKLANSHVLCIGGGGLAASVLPYLVAAGVGSITIVDYDTVSLTNLNRQILFNEDDIGKFKAQVLQSRLIKQNSAITINSICESFGLDNGAKLVAEHDLVIDCCDDYLTKVAINYHCSVTKTPWVFASVLAWDGQISLLTMSDEFQPCYKCWQEKAPQGNQSCAVSGVMGVAVNLVGSFQASLAIQALLGEFGQANKLFVFDLWTLEMSKFDLARRKNCAFHKNSPHQNIVELNLDECSDSNNYRLIDIRSLEEWEQGYLPNAEHIPIGALMTMLDELKHDKRKIVLYCNQQTLSQLAVDNLCQIGIDAYVLRGGYLNNIATKVKE